MQNNNPLTEAFLGATAVLLVLGAIVLLYTGKIDGTFATLMFGAAAALFGGNLALKAPSPAQQQQIAAQHQSLQSMLSQLLQALPALFQQAGTPPPVVVNNLPAQPAAQPLPPVPMPAAAVQPPQSSMPDFTAPIQAIPKQ